MELIILPHRSVGPIQFGMSTEKVKRIFPGGKHRLLNHDVIDTYVHSLENYSSPKDAYLALLPGELSPEISTDNEVAKENSIRYGRSEVSFKNPDLRVFFEGDSSHICCCIEVFSPNCVLLDGRDILALPIQSTVDWMEGHGRKIEIYTEGIIIPDLGIILGCEDVDLFGDSPPTVVTAHSFGTLLSGCWGKPKRIINF